jgi:peptide deformylase
MARREVLEYPDPRLRLVSKPVIEFDSEIAELVADLFDTMYAGNAIGLSAPQLDVQREVLVMDLSGDASAPQVFINPEILDSARPGFVEESCLSVPGVVTNVLSATRVRVRARDSAGEFFERDLADMEAVCLQHEMDHLAGKVLADRLSAFRRWRLRRAAARANPAFSGI